ncbi:MAG TPA: GxxExxY protein [Gemmatimonadaceae bacterium]|nr:GxxExxY protein [Gemmatimonadaceae bacterium]
MRGKNFATPRLRLRASTRSRATPQIRHRLDTDNLGLIYCDALAVEFELRGIPFTRDATCQLIYKGRPLTGHHRLDFVCFDEVVVEIKAQSSIGPAEEAQVLNYLALTHKRIGLLVNFGERSLAQKRFILDP